MTFQVHYGIIDEQHNLPFVITNQGDVPDLAPEAYLAWYQECQGLIQEKLLVHGAVLFRGFGITSPTAFWHVAKGLSPRPFDYVDGNSPRRKIASGVYTSTEYPPDYMISLHNELSYSPVYPSRLLFGCIIPAEHGGETPLVDSRTLLQALSPELIERFRSKGVKYIRNLHGGRGVGPSWQETFETEERQAVEAFASAKGIKIQWKADGGCRVEQVRPATAIHPRTGQEVWFNQADQFHPSTLPRPVYESIAALYGTQEEELPQTACFGDGTPIELDMLESIRQATAAHMVLFPWQSGDLVLIDNMLLAHGRMPFKGPRRILVSMFED
jgi:alpha-ketoglutarate-dependent taurine dioxygenase